MGNRELIQFAIVSHKLTLGFRNFELELEISKAEPHIAID